MVKHDVRIDVRKLHPNLRHKLNALLKECTAAGIGIIITEGYRTKAYQDMLYAIGRTVPGNKVTNAKGSSYSSQHQWGIAFDIAINDKNRLYDAGLIKQVADIAKRLNLSWGGDWVSFKDTPHFYLGKWGASTSELRRQYGTPDKFFKTWTATVTRDKLRLYKGTKKVKTLKRIAKGDKVHVLYRKLWYAKVEHDGDVGYVRKKYLK